MVMLLGVWMARDDRYNAAFLRSCFISRLEGACSVRVGMRGSDLLPGRVYICRIFPSLHASSPGSTHTFNSQLLVPSLCCLVCHLFFLLSRRGEILGHSYGNLFCSDLLLDGIQYPFHG